MNKLILLNTLFRESPTLTGLALLGGMTAAVLMVHTLLYLFLKHLTRKNQQVFLESMMRHFRQPSRWLLLLLGFKILLPTLPFDAGHLSAINHLLSLALIALIAWMAVRMLSVLEEHLKRKFDLNTKDNLRARKIHTQLRVLKRIASILIWLVAFSAALMTFEQIRQIGTTLLASAGLAGLVIGLAAQKTISTFLAGIQVALTQPIRIDDVVIVENEWGRIEEITLTYVVVKIWDQRRLIVPLSYFIERPFQNWTRVSADLLATVVLYLDYTVPFEEIRKELNRLAEASEYWDRKVCGLQVTNATERTVELRALLSAADASAAWNLRCQIREKLIEFVQQKYPQALPRIRGEWQALPQS
jgi:small-conductance mechanosensitive channel